MCQLSQGLKMVVDINKDHSFHLVKASLLQVYVMEREGVLNVLYTQCVYNHLFVCY